MHNSEQILASNPKYSVWLSSSAGAGKTKVLTDRIIRLLLAGVSPHKILCLTFTNAAASEMLARINKLVNLWMEMTDKELKLELQKITGQEYDSKLFIKARKLSEDLFQTKTLKIYTIHAFCQKILKHFPREAGLNPHFTIMSEIKTKQIAQDLTLKLINSSHENHSIQIEQFHQYTLAEIVTNIMSDSNVFQTLFNKFENKNLYYEYLIAFYNLQFKTITEVFEYFVPKLIDIKLIGEIDLVKKIQDYLFQSLNFQIETFEEFSKLFLTLDGLPKKSLITKDQYKSNLDIKIQLEKIQSVIYDIHQNIVNIKVLEGSSNIFAIAKDVLSVYREYKTKHNNLDYNDLIYFSCKLLQDSYWRDWVLYKLDSQIEHLLIDEAQDTSPEQWDIIHAVIEDFFAGIGAKDDAGRSVFVVGDEKQSIYSFQGANLNNFLFTKLLLKHKLTQAGKEFLDLEMLTSYRSGPAINNFVFNLLLTLKEKNLIANIPPPLNVSKYYYASRIELLPAIVNEETSEYFWPYYDKILDEHDAAEIEAQRIAKKVKNLLDSKVILPSTGKVISTEDIMILVPSRRNFIEKLTRNCQNLGIKISGLDRISLKASLSVLDMMSILKYIIQNDDELNLSALLKSPIISITEENLQKILLLRLQHKTSLDNFLRTHQGEYSEIVNKLDIFKLLYTKTNFPELIHIILDVMDYQSILLLANGKEEIDTIEEFFNIAKDYHDNINSNLSEFIAWFDNNDIDVKRDLGVVQGHLRILTIHGSKGLESPVVILPETFTSNFARGNYFWTNDGLLLLNDSQSKIASKAKEQKNITATEEYWRLLYVALTRAQDYLIISGYHQERSKNHTNSWHSLLTEVMQNIPNTIVQEDGTMIYQEGNFTFAENTMPNQIIVKDNTKRLKNISQKFNISNFLDLHSNENQNYKNGAEKQYGIVAHRILEDIFSNKNTNILNSHPMLKSLPENLASTIILELENLFATNKEVVSWFNYPLKIEQEILMRQIDYLLLGRIDLIILKPNEVMIIDYKTDHTPPSLVSSIPNKYKDQLISYAHALQTIYPDKIVTTHILWIKNGSLMKIS